MSANSVSLPAKWTPYLQSLARIIFGFLVLRHGMEQVLGYPEASPAAMTSFGGGLELMAFPGGLLIMLGLFTRPVCLVLSIMYLVFWFVGPLQSSLVQGRALFGGRGPSDPLLLNCFFFLYLTTAGGGAWSLDRLRNPAGEAASDATWAPYSLGLLRIVAGFLFLHHGLEKWFGPRAVRDITTLRGFAGLLENAGGPLLMLGLFTRPLAFILSGEMAVAYFISWAPRGFWQSFTQPGMEASILNCFLFLFLCSAGPGAWSLDSLWRRTRGHVRSPAEVRVSSS